MAVAFACGLATGLLGCAIWLCITKLCRHRRDAARPAQSPHTAEAASSLGSQEERAIEFVAREVNPPLGDLQVVVMPSATNSDRRMSAAIKIQRRARQRRQQHGVPSTASSNDAEMAAVLIQRAARGRLARRKLLRASTNAQEIKASTSRSDMVSTPGRQSERPPRLSAQRSLPSASPKRAPTSLKKQRTVDALIKL